MPRLNKRSAFTLVELLVVIAIIGVLVALLLPAVQAAREAARRSQCTNNMKQVALGLLNYESAKGALPGGSSYEERNIAIADRKNWQRWVVSVLPYMEQATIHQQISLKDPFDIRDSSTAGVVRNNKLAATTIISSLICPSDIQAGEPILDGRTTSGDNPEVCQGLWYRGSMGPTIPDQCAFLAPTMTARDAASVCMGSNYGSNFPSPDANFMAPCYKPSALVRCPDTSVCVGMICRNLKGVELREASDGTSNTFLLGETLPAHSKYNCTFCENFNTSSTHIPLNTMEDENGTPASTHPRAAGFKSLHQGGVQFAFSDGSVHFIPENADYFIVNALGTKAAEESNASVGSF
jgi:prepilin-type N-terminal cleavage/methylation domain-containing protein/prepilin-type processing-associated H-X9-DG protein